MFFFYLSHLFSLKKNSILNDRDNNTTTNNNNIINNSSNINNNNNAPFTFLSRSSFNSTNSVLSQMFSDKLVKPNCSQQSEILSLSLFVCVCVCVCVWRERGRNKIECWKRKYRIKNKQDEDGEATVVGFQKIMKQIQQERLSIKLMYFLFSKIFYVKNFHLISSNNSLFHHNSSNAKMTKKNFH